MSQAWDARLAGHASPPPLLQSWGWGRVQAGSGWEVERLWLGGGGQASVLLRKAGPVAWAYVPRGPVPTGEQHLDALVEWARSARVARLRVEPEAGPELAPILQARRFRAGPEVQPRHTIIVKLAAEDEMLASFKPKTRYNIRLALRRGVSVEAGADIAELESQTAATATRQRINLASGSHYRRLLRELEWCRIYVARLEGEAVAAILVARFGGRAYYLYGGSSGRHRGAMPNHALHWAAMKDAAVAGCRDYDLWGVAPPDRPDHPWAGLNQFKAGYGGSWVQYAGAWDLVFDAGADRALRAAEKWRDLSRRLRARTRFSER